MDFLLDPFRSDSAQSGLLAAVLVGASCGMVGCYIVLRGMALMADSLVHGVLPGIAIAFAITAGADGDPDQLAITLGAVAAGLFTAVATAAILRRSRLRDETAIAVVFIFMLALGVVLISRVNGYEEDLEAFLFGDVIGVGGGDVIFSAAVAALIGLTVILLYRPFLLFSFDPARAATLGLPVDRLHLAMLVLVTMTVVVGFRVVGSLLVLGMLLAPPAAAALVTRRLPAMMVVSAGIAIASAPVGMELAWHLDLTAGAAIVLVPVAAFVALLAVSPQAR